MYLRAGLAVAVVVGLAAEAAAKPVAVADLRAPPEHSVEAGALSLVMRSHIGARRQRVPRARLAAAIEAIGAARPGLLAVEPAAEASLAEALEAQLISGSLRPGTGELIVELVVRGPGGKELGRHTARAPPGELDPLAAELVAAASELIGRIGAAKPTPTSYAELAAAARAAESLARGEAEEAARLFAAAPPRLGFRFPAVRDIAAEVWRDESLPLELRINAALVGGDLAAARGLVEGSSEPVARAGAARIALARLDYRAARGELEGIGKSKEPFVILARADLAGELGDEKALARALLELLEGDEPYVPALAVAARLRPGMLGAAGEKKVIAAAAAVADEHPALAARLGVRALRAGDRSPQIFRLISVYEIDGSELRVVSDALAQAPEGDPNAARLEAEIAVRQGRLEDARRALATAVELAADDPRVARTAAILEGGDEAVAAREEALGDTAADGPEAGEPAQARELTLLGEELLPLLEAFSALRRGIGRVVLVPLEGSGALPLWPLRVHPDKLRDGLVSALGSPTFDLAVAVESAPLGAAPTAAQLSGLAREHGAAGVLGYALETDGTGVRIELLFFYAASSRAEKVDERFAAGRAHGLVSWNPIFIAAVAVLVLGALGWLIWIVVRGSGTVQINLDTDPAAERPSYSILISKSRRCPAVTDPKAYLAKVTTAARKGRFRADNVGSTEEFERIPPGSWYVHVIGTFSKGGELRCLPAISESVKVRRNQVVSVRIDLVPKECEFHFVITGDEGPVRGAVITLEGQSQTEVTDGDGTAVMHIPPGEHEIRIHYRGLDLTRKVHAYGTKISKIHLNLTRERRLAQIAGGLEVGEYSGSEAEIIRAESFDSRRTAEAVTRPAPGADAPADQALTGLDRYRAEEELGRGAMGVVYRAVDQVLGRPVALKVMSPEIKNHPSAAQMFEQEAKALAALNHPNVVTVFDQGRDQDQMYLVMEFVDGTTLEQVLRRRTQLPLGEAAHLGEQLGRGLSYAHSRRVIHRDIKPANVFIASDGTAKLGDFGLARTLDELRIKATEVKGTPLYMAPEQIRGTDIDFRADIYALGCTLYEVLAGRPPFIEGEILYHHMHTDPPPLGQLVEVPAGVEELIMRCIAKEAADRVASADRIAEVFGEVRRAA